MLRKFKILIAVIIIFLTSILVIQFDFFQVKTKIYKEYPNLFLRHFLFKKESVKNNVLNDYNIKFLPYSQFFKLNLKKIRLIFDEQYYDPQNQKSRSTSYSTWGTFYFENYSNNLIVTDYKGSIYYYDKFNKVLNSPNEKINLKNQK